MRSLTMSMPTMGHQASGRQLPLRDAVVSYSGTHRTNTSSRQNKSSLGVSEGTQRGNESICFMNPMSLFQKPIRGFPLSPSTDRGSKLLYAHSRSLRSQSRLPMVWSCGSGVTTRPGRSSVERRLIVRIASNSFDRLCGLSASAQVLTGRMFLGSEAPSSRSSLAEMGRSTECGLRPGTR